MPSDRPDYAALIGEDQSQREEHCLAQAIYFEARSESEKGQAAVAQVVLNRVSSGLSPADNLRRRLPEPAILSCLSVLICL